MKCDFSLRHYFEVLDLAKKDYTIGPIKNFVNLRKEKKFILLRHDVDGSLDYALNMGKLEAEHGLQSTYFILLHSPHYNALSQKNISIINELKNLGHEIGLHYDTTFSNSYKNAITQINLEVSLLENIIESKIYSIVQHNESISLNFNKNLISGFLDARSNTILKSVKYISDSVQNWRSGCMCNHIGKEHKLQILTHPIWWSNVHKSRKQIHTEFEKSELKKIKKNNIEYRNFTTKYHHDLKKGNIQ